MDTRDEIRDFLTSRRAKIPPERAGFAGHGGNRRVAGLRREEVALLAGISVEYYIRLERGNARGVSDGVLESLARALQLVEAERGYLFDLVHAANADPRALSRRADQPLRPSVRRLLDAMVTAPAYVWNGRLDVLAANQLGRALFAPMLAGSVRPANQARFIFLDPQAPQFFVEWEQLAHDAVAMLRTEAGRHPHDERLAELIQGLSTRSETFRTMWAAHDVRCRRTGVKRFHHPVVGPLTVTFESMGLVTDTDLRITAGTAEPGSSSEHALNLLASWTATSHDEVDGVRTGDRS
ncbi:helix-turn-helix domain-containing protein [Nonomuraea basaltis]|uniref:helix-turn-helix domain-containing protein n=1 Tax=Nonomuraea basaltis TaxID=2495887 RepID=UPI00110C61B9|nr:helix-turn-helix transcriptional regulator [Nonomuraea basaltis]TMR97200.1 helix-turn-helix transcriptional regulator [Nonomuraea basaltis]